MAWPPQQINQATTITRNLGFERQFVPLHLNPYIALGEEWPLVAVGSDTNVEESYDSRQIPAFRHPEDVTITPNSEETKGKPEKLIQKPSISTSTTTKKPHKPQKLIKLTPIKVQPPKNAFDIKFLKVQELSRKIQDKARFIVEQLMFIPGRHLINLDKNQAQMRLKSKILLPQQLPKVKMMKFNQKLMKNDEKLGKLVKVDSVGMVSADKPITGYEAYFPDSPENGEEATLLLEPQSRAIAGNGGTAISAPVSRAILKRGSRTKVLFKPSSVAIAGARGKAHASAELILDYVE